MTTHPDQAELEGQCREILQQLAGFGDLRPGTLSHRYVKCGKKACHCAEPGDPGHGPIWSLTWHADGKTRTRSIPPEAVEETRAQLAEYKRLRAVVATLVEISTELCDVRLGAARGSKKKTPPSKRRSRRKSPPNSTA